jgi:protein-S-isoprenylcysteine O-methyltransferase Ste14
MSGLPLGRTAIVVFVVGAVLFPLGMVGQGDGGLWEDGPGWIGAVGWFGFLLCLLLLLAIAVVALARTVSSRRTAKG